MMSMCRAVSWVIGKGYLLWLASSCEKTLLAFTLLHFILQDQTCLLFWVSLDFLILHSNPLWWKGHPFLVFILDVVGLNRTNQLQILWHQGLGHRLGLLWYWIVCCENELRSFSPFWNCFQVLHFGLFHRLGHIMKVKSFSHVRLFATPWAIESMEFSRSEYWTG